MTVEMQNSKEHCGLDFIDNRMACAYDSEETKSAVDNFHYCHVSRQTFLINTLDNHIQWCGAFNDA